MASSKQKLWTKAKQDALQLLSSLTKRCTIFETIVINWISRLVGCYGDQCLLPNALLLRGQHRKRDGLDHFHNNGTLSGWNYGACIELLDSIAFIIVEEHPVFF